MTRKLVLLILLFVLGQALALADYVPGEILIKTKAASGLKAAAVSAVAKKHGLIKQKKMRRAKDRLKNEHQAGGLAAEYYQLVFSEQTDIQQVIKDLKADPEILIAQPNYIYNTSATVPDDPTYAEQWALAKINASLAWDNTTGTNETVIAILDTGVDYTHPDLQAKVDTTNMYDYVNEDNDAMDDEGHGTAVAGAAAAITNNGVGVAGVDWHARILPLKVLYPVTNGASGTTEDITDALGEAKSRGADVVNMSFGMYLQNNDNDEMMAEAVAAAFAEGLILVAAAGNDNTDSKSYPAANDNVLAVAATDENDLRSVWVNGRASNYGTWVDVSAPGTSVYTTRWEGGYIEMSGTSFSCPIVAGLTGLIKSAYPTLTNSEIMDMVILTTDSIDSLNPSFVGRLGSGRVNAYLAVAGVESEITSPADDAYLSGDITITGTAAGWDFVSYALEALSDGVFATTIESSVAAVEGGTLGTWDTGSLSGDYEIRLRVTSASLITGEHSVTITLDNTDPVAEITFPAAGASLQNNVIIKGSASDDYLSNYILEYGQGTSPTSYNNIKTGYVSVAAGVLGTWETSGLTGEYTIKLTAVDRVGGQAEASVSVVILESVTVTKEAEAQPGLALTYALPNPFNRNTISETTFNYTLSGNFDTKIYLFNLSGTLIWQQTYNRGQNGAKAGANNPPWNGRDLFGRSVPAGVYIYQVLTDRKVIASGKTIVLN
ncbi:MAG: S8 family serine peptidase [bacterium]